MNDEDKAIEEELLKLEIFADSIDKQEKTIIDKGNSVHIFSQEGKNEFKEKVKKQEQIKQQINSLKQEDGTEKKPIVLRTSAGKVWNDPSLAEWPENDYRIKVDNLHDKVNDHILYEAFKQYKSLSKVHVVRDSSGRSRQYGFVSILDVNDYIEAMKTVDNTFIGSRRVKLHPSKWKYKLLPK